uniref:Uncharacterized protein n=1 Tax=Vespula pensylvanica TaxID=30213 RepID=A0A834P345_VESPE|nr:hypothetical protein H0235_008280 [Vespula pensylvanica]
MLEIGILRYCSDSIKNASQLSEGRERKEEEEEEEEETEEKEEERNKVVFTLMRNERIKRVTSDSSKVSTSD